MSTLHNRAGLPVITQTTEPILATAPGAASQPSTKELGASLNLALERIEQLESELAAAKSRKSRKKGKRR